jgi:acyl dehydratase
VTTSGTTSDIPTYASVEVGDALPTVQVQVHRADLIRYAGASGDFNPIHWNPRHATAVGLPDVIAHGMLSMGLASRVLIEWVGDPTAIVEFGVRFTNPVVVPDDDQAATVTFGGTVAAKLDDHQVRVTLTATCNVAKILGAAKAIVRLP